MAYDPQRKRLYIELDPASQEHVREIENWYGQSISKIMMPDVIYAIKKTKERIEAPAVPFEKKRING